MNPKDRDTMYLWDCLMARMAQGYITMSDELIDRNLYSQLQPKVIEIIKKYNPKILVEEGNGKEQSTDPHSSGGD